MYGVVLWSDRNQNRAVIWCEDHGDLAFYAGESDAMPSADFFEPGDLVQFQVRQSRNMRLAWDVSVVSSEQYPTLAQDLKDAGRDEPQPRAQDVPGGSAIIPFCARSAAPDRVPESRRGAG